MHKEELKKILMREVDEFTNKPFDELMSIKFPLAYQMGTPNSSNFYQVEIDILEKTKNYIHIIIDIDTGSLRSTVSPISTNFIVYKNGQAEK